MRGGETAGFGKYLLQYVKSETQYQDCKVYYDHGDKNDPNVCVIKGFWGNTVKNSNRLADVDIVLTRQNGDILCLIEIEETSATPKKLLGDIFAILMCNGFAVGPGKKQRYLNITPETKLIVAGVGSDKGGQIDKAQKVIKTQLEQFEAPGDSIKSRNVVLMVEGSLGTTLEQVEKSVKQILISRCA